MMPLQIPFSHLSLPAVARRCRRVLLAAVAAGLAAAAVPTVANAATLTDDFSAGINANYFTVVQSTAGLYAVDTGNNSLQLTKTGTSPGGFQSADIVLNVQKLVNQAEGDFSVQIDFSNAVVGPNVDQVELHTRFADGTIFYDVFDNSGDGTNVHVWNGSVVNGRTAVNTNSGTFRISRTGPTVTGTYNGVTIYSQTITSALTAVDFLLQNQPGSDDATAVTFDNFSFTAPFTVTLTNPIPSVAAGSGNYGEFLLTLPVALSTDLVVNYAVKGDAANGTDYVLLKGTKTIKAGKTGKQIKVLPLGDLGSASKKTVALELEAGTGYAVGTPGKVKVKINAPNNVILLP